MAAIDPRRVNALYAGGESRKNLCDRIAALEADLAEVREAFATTLRGMCSQQSCWCCRDLDYHVGECKYRTMARKAGVPV